MVEITTTSTEPMMSCARMSDDPQVCFQLFFNAKAIARANLFFSIVNGVQKYGTETECKIFFKIKLISCNVKSGV